MCININKQYKFVVGEEFICLFVMVNVEVKEMEVIQGQTFRFWLEFLCLHRNSLPV